MIEAELEAHKEEALAETLKQIDGYFEYFSRLAEQSYEACSNESDLTQRMAAYGLIIQLGEAVKFLPQRYRAEHGEGRWKAIIDMRSRVAHQYNDVDWELICATLKYFHPVDAHKHAQRS